MNQTRPHLINFRVSDEELQQLQTQIKNSGLSTQKFLLRVVLEKPIMNEEVLQEFLIELRQQSVNLKEAAKKCESDKASNSVIEAANKLEQFLQECRTQFID